MAFLQKLEYFDLNKRQTINLFGLIIAGYCIVTLAGNPFGFSLDYEGVVLRENCFDYGIIKGKNLCGDYVLRERYLSEWHLDWLVNDFRHGIVLSLLVLSREVFGEPRILAFVSSIVFVGLTYLVGRALSNRRFVGLVAMLFVLASPIFNKYDTGITYPTFWASFYMASILAILKMPKIAWLGFMFAIFFKNIAVLYLPASMLFTKYSNLDAKSKKYVYVTHVAVIATGLVFLVFEQDIAMGVISQINVDLVDFVWWLGMWAIEFSDDRVSLFVMFFVIGGLMILKRQNVPNAASVLLMLVVILLQPAFIAGFTDYTNEDYRFVIAVAFVGIGLGMIVSNFGKLVSGIQMPKH